MMWKNLYVAGKTGSEQGLIIADEEYKDTCRITLEQCKNYYAVTCGVYGAMVHTAFADPDTCQTLYSDMKKELQEFIDRETTPDEENEFYRNFTQKY